MHIPWSSEEKAGYAFSSQLKWYVAKQKIARGAYYLSKEYLPAHLQ